MDGPQSSGNDQRLELVVVALPADNDKVRKYSNEKEPHLTLLYLGTPKLTKNELSNVIAYIGFAASRFKPFDMCVSERGTLGENLADVLFFDKRFSRDISEFRNHLLQNPIINQSYLTTDQFPEWIPHLTMGFPETPANEDDDHHHYGPNSWVIFDKIALWTGDSEGPTFKLKSDDYATEVGMYQSDLRHYGVKGMKWGVHRSPAQLGHDPDSADVVSAKAAKAKIARNRGKTDSLSNKDLQDLLTRMDLEQRYNKIKNDQKPINRGNKKVQDILNKSKTLNEVYNVINSPIAKAIRKGLTGI